MSLEFMQRYKLWPDLISKFDLIHGETMFGLEEARGGVQAPAPRGLLQGQFLGQEAIERASDDASDGSWSYRRSDGWWRWNIVL